MLSATTHWISYSAQVTAVKAYIDGYAQPQQAERAAACWRSAPTTTVGRQHRRPARLGRAVVDPIAVYAARYHGVAVAGANDMEPGFYAGVSAHPAWLSGYLSATGAQFVFNGSADGCSTAAAAGQLQQRLDDGRSALASGGAAPTRIDRLPQIYNTAMPCNGATSR